MPHLPPLPESLPLSTETRQLEFATGPSTPAIKGEFKDDPSFKRQQRLIRNRASAQQSRERKKQYVSQLEAQVKALQTQVAVLVAENEQLKLIANGASGGRKRLRTELDPISTHATHDRSASGTSLIKSSVPFSTPPLIFFAFVFSFALFFNFSGLTYSMVSSPSASTLSESRISVVSTGRVLTSDANHLMSSLQLEESEDARKPNASFPVDLYKRQEKDFLSNDNIDLVKMAHKMMILDPSITVPVHHLPLFLDLIRRGNFSSDDASYMFCPSPVQVRPAQLWAAAIAVGIVPKAHENEEQSTALVTAVANSARALPARLGIRPNSNKVIVLPAENKEQSLPAIPHSQQEPQVEKMGDQSILKLWMPASYFDNNFDAWPSSSLNESGNERRSPDASSGPSVTRGITQFACLVKEIRSYT